MILFVVLVFLTIYVVRNKDLIIREHLTSGPPSLLTLQKDTQDLQNQITTVQTQIESMKQQAQAQSSQAAAAKAQLTAAKSS